MQQWCGFGTPNRIVKLIDMNALKLKGKSPLCVIDGRINSKGYNILNIKDLKKDMGVMIKHIIENNGKILFYQPNVRID